MELTDKEWRDILDRYLLENTMYPDDYERLNDYQKFTIQSIKKSIKRLQDKILKQNGEYETKKYL